MRRGLLLLCVLCCGTVAGRGAEPKLELVVQTGHTSSVNSASLSRDGSRALTGSGDDTAILWDAKTGQKIRTFAGHTSWVNSVTLSQDGTRALTGSFDGTTRLWDTKTGKELCSLISIDASKDWLVITPDGYFDGSENATKLISYRIAGTLEFVPLERYRKQFERPGLLAMIWKGEDYRGKVAVKQDLPPTVRITSPVNNFTSKDGKLTITAEAQSRGEYPVTSFRLKVNGKPHVKNQGLFDVPSPKTGKATAKWEIDLEVGRHNIEVLAYTRAVFNVSEHVEVKHVGGGQQPKIKLPTLYVLAVGISKYANKDERLDFAHRDAEEIVKAYQKYGKPLFDKIEVRLLTDAKATREAVLEGLEWLRKNATQKDFAVFFFAGHGVKDNRDKFFLLPVDGDREKLTRTAIDGTVISDELVSIPGQLLVLLDACHSGKIGGNKTRGLTEDLLKDLSSEEKGVAIMCSATSRQLAQESREHQHGLFTVALLEAIRGTGNGGKGKDELKVRLSDGAVYFKQLDSYVTDRVKQLSKGYQHPVTCVPRNFRDFPVSKPQ